MTQFQKNILILTLILAALSAILFFTILKQYYFQGFPILLLFISGITLIMHQFLLKKSINPKKFFTAFMGATGLKLLIYMFIALIYMFFDKANAPAFAISLLLLYFIYTYFEIKYLLKELKASENTKG